LTKILFFIIFVFKLRAF